MTCYVIAEAGVAHEGSLGTARTLLNTASAAGADAFKIQHFKKGMKRRDDTLLPVMDNDDIRELSRDCRARGLDFIITPHDEWALDFIKKSDLICDKMKIGSGDWHLLYLLRRPVRNTIISTGMHTDEEIDDMMASMGSEGVVYLHCVSEYPATSATSRLWYMKKMMNDHPECVIGYSDHTVGTTIPLAAAAMGAQVIEKHITIDEDVPGKADTYISLRHDMFIKFVRAVREIEASLAEPSIRQVTPSEQRTKEWVIESRGLTLDTWR